MQPVACANQVLGCVRVQVEFQDKLLPPTTTWTDLRGMVKASPKPWSFLFQSDVPAWEEEEDSDEDAL